jgi:hypothetical protein
MAAQYQLESGWNSYHHFRCNSRHRLCADEGGLNLSCPARTSQNFAAIPLYWQLGIGCLQIP